jgi:hypothetical protein
VREGHRGQSLDQNVTFRDLVSGGFATTGAGGSSVGPRPGTPPVIPTAPPPATPPDLTPPPAVCGASATPGLNVFFLSWTQPVYTQGGGHAYVEVWGAPNTGVAPTFANAVLLDRVPANLFSYAAGLNVRWHFWFISVSRANVPQTVPTGGTNGISAQTGLVGGTDIAAAAIGTALIGDEVVTNSKIVDLSVVKLTAGALQVGSYIRSTAYVAGVQGWNISADGTAEFGAASIRGQLVASQINTAGLTIRDAGGTVIFSATTPLTGTFIADATIPLAKINVATIGQLSALSATIGLLRTAASGARLEISDNVIRVFDGVAAQARVVLGNLDLG